MNPSGSGEDSPEPSLRDPRRRSRWLRWTVALLGGGLGALFVLGLFKDPLLKKLLQTNLERQTGLRTEIGSLNLGLTTGTLHITNLKLYNPPGFDDQYLLDIPEIFVQIRPATNKASVAYREIRLNVATLNVVKNAAGEFNLRSLEEPARRHRTRSRRNDGSDAFGGIDRISLTLGQINYIDLAKPKRNQQLQLEIDNVTANNLTSEEELRAWLGSLLARLIFRELFHDPPPMRLFWKWLLRPSP